MPHFPVGHRTESPSTARVFRLGAVVIALSLCGFSSSAAARAPEPAEAVAVGVVRPEEGQVERLYRTALGRPSERRGFEYWVIRRQTGTSLRRVAEYVLDSAEYRQRFRPENDDNPAFVDRVYQLVLGRSSDAAGRRYWLGRLEGGLRREALVLHFSESTEFKIATGTQLLPLPAFFAASEAVTADDLGQSWRPGCPVGPASLRLLSVTHVDGDGQAEVGRIVVDADVVEDVVAIFARLYADRFPVARMIPVSRYGGDDVSSMEDNNTSGFNCRRITGGSRWSRHAYGRAIDINPVMNPYSGGSDPDTVLPENGASFVDRAVYHPMMIRDGDIVVTAFESRGWIWGGRWSSPTDPQHFEFRPR